MNKETNRQIFHVAVGIITLFLLAILGRGFMTAAVFFVIIIGTILMNLRIQGARIFFVDWFEEHNLPTLLRSLAAQECVPEEIIVVDDESDDETAAVAARLGARVVAAEPMPEGWVGKSWACWTGARSAKGDPCRCRRSRCGPGRTRRCPCPGGS